MNRGGRGWASGAFDLISGWNSRSCAYCERLLLVVRLPVIHIKVVGTSLAIMKGLRPWKRSALEGINIAIETLQW